MTQLNFPVTCTNFRFEPPNFLVAGWMLVGFGSFSSLKKNFPVLGLHFPVSGWGGAVSLARGMVSVLNYLFSTLSAK